MATRKNAKPKAETKEKVVEEPVVQDTEEIVEEENEEVSAPKKNPTEALSASTVPLEVVVPPEELPDHYAVSQTDVKAQLATINVDRKLQGRINSETAQLGSILHILQLRVGNVLRKQKITSRPVSNLVCLDRYLKRSRVDSGTVRFNFPIVNVLVETSGAESNKKQVIDPFLYDSAALADEPIATIRAKLVFYEGEQLKLKTTLAVAPVQQGTVGKANKPAGFKTIGYWVLESIEEE